MLPPPQVRISTWRRARTSCRRTRSFWAIYVKGMARSCSARAVVDLVLEAREMARAPPSGEGVAAPALAVAGSLDTSFAVVHIRRGTSALDRTTVALENARLGAKRGHPQATRCHHVGGDTPHPSEG